MKLGWLLLIVLGGLAVGFSASAWLWPVPSRAQRTVQLFEEACLANPEATETEIAERLHLEPWRHHSSEPGWFDPASRNVVSFSASSFGANSCGLSTSSLFVLTRDEANEVVQLLEPLVARYFPNLPHDPKADLGPHTISKAWMTGQVATRERWGVYFFAWPAPDSGENASSSLTYSPEPAD